jgi:hypothetical protein
MRLVAASNEDEMVACFLLGELSSERFGEGVREALDAAGLSERLLVEADLSDEADNERRRALLGSTRGYGQDRDLFDGGFPTDVDWVWAELTPAELARVRYVDYSYWNELSGGTRLPSEAAVRIRRGVRALGVPNDRLLEASLALIQGKTFPPMILAGTEADSLVCLEGHVRLTAHALEGFPRTVRCLVGISPDLAGWAR